jgi:putative flavoprotein involved in K+ transport
VLVVGGGNTGFQIAEELSRTHEVHLSIGTRQTPLPQRIAGRDLFRYLEATRLMGKTANSRIGQRLQDRDTLIGSSPRAARRRGIHLHGRTVDVSARDVTFSDGARLHPNTVVWATGFGVDHSWIDAPVFDGDGRLVHDRGVTASPGLYFLGLPWQHTRGSALLGWVKDDAEYLAHRICATAAAWRPRGAARGTPAAVSVAATVPALGTRTTSPHARRLAGTSHGGRVADRRGITAAEECLPSSRRQSAVQPAPCHRP